MKKILLATALSSLIMSGCASIVSDSNYPVTINSTPTDAQFVIKNEAGVEIQTGRTPSTVTLKSGDGYFSSANYTVILKKDGFDEKTITIKSTMDGWYWGNILFGGVIGMLIIDPATGSMWKLPEGQSVSLDQSVANRADQTSLQIISLNEVPAEQRGQLIQIN